MSRKKSSNIYFLFLLALSISTTLSLKHEATLISKVKTDKQYSDPSFPKDSIYTIETERISTTHEDESNKCTAMPKRINVNSQFEKFRAGASDQHTRQ